MQRHYASIHACVPNVSRRIQIASNFRSIECGLENERTNPRETRDESELANFCEILSRCRREVSLDADASTCSPFEATGTVFLYLSTSRRHSHPFARVCACSRQLLLCTLRSILENFKRAPPNRRSCDLTQTSTSRIYYIPGNEVSLLVIPVRLLGRSATPRRRHRRSILIDSEIARRFISHARRKPRVN